MRESAEAKVSADVGAQLKFEVRFLHASTRSGRRVGGGRRAAIASLSRLPNEGT